MTQDELILLLAPIRIPAHFAEFGMKDALLALCLGLLAGLLLARLIGFITTPAIRTRSRVQAEIALLADADQDTRLTGLAVLLNRYDPQAAARLGLSRALYDPATTVDIGGVEKAILDAARSDK